MAITYRKKMAMDTIPSPILSPADLDDYQLIDTGGYEKLERFGRYVLSRPEPQAIWAKSLSDKQWRDMADARFERDRGSDERGRWITREGMADRWYMDYSYGNMDMKLRLALTSFKHVGVFPEQSANWRYIYDEVSARMSHGVPSVLNLFAYTGGASLAACAAGAKVTHVDSVKQVVTWARENMETSGLDGIRWIVEDARKFVSKEVRRGHTYDGIILDPPAYGRGAEGEKWVLEQDLYPLMTECRQLLADNGFMILNLYSMGFSSLLAHSLLHQLFPKAAIDHGELYLTDNYGKSLPLSTFARFSMR